VTYRARNLPAWVKFRAKPKTSPVYTVLTAREHRLKGLADVMLRSLMPQMLKKLDNDRGFWDGIHWQRVQLPNGYTKA
jgi:hypothetical protein